MKEPQVAAKVSVDEQGRVIITDPQLAEALKSIAQRLPPQLAAANNVVQCGCNLVANCGGSLA